MGIGMGRMGLGMGVEMRMMSRTVPEVRIFGLQEIEEDESTSRSEKTIQKLEERAMVIKMMKGQTAVDQIKFERVVIVLMIFGERDGIQTDRSDIRDILLCDFLVELFDHSWC